MMQAARRQYSRSTTEQPSNNNNNPTAIDEELDLLTTTAAAAAIGLAPRTLADMRWKGGGPEFCRIAHNRVRYRRAKLMEWVARRTFGSTSEER